jgi:hypothetical protein
MEESVVSMCRDVQKTAVVLKLQNHRRDDGAHCDYRSLTSVTVRKVSNALSSQYDYVLTYSD